MVVARLDRLGRRLREQIDVREAMRAIGVTIHVVKDGGEIGDLTASMLGLVAEFESQRLADRVKDVRLTLAGKGWWSPGRVGWGWRLRDATKEERALGAPRRVLMEDPAAEPAVRELYRWPGS